MFLDKAREYFGDKVGFTGVSDNGGYLRVYGVDETVAVTRKDVIKMLKWCYGDCSGVEVRQCDGAVHIKSMVTRIMYGSQDSCIPYKGKWLYYDKGIKLSDKKCEFDREAFAEENDILDIVIEDTSVIRGSFLLDDKYITSMAISDAIVLHSDKDKSRLPFEAIKQVHGVLNMPVVYEGRAIDLDKVKLVEGDYVLNTRQYYIEILFNHSDGGDIWESHHIYTVKKADESGITVTTKFGTNYIVGRGLDLFVEDKVSENQRKVSIFGKEDEVLAEFDRVMKDWLDLRYKYIYGNIRGMLSELKGE